MGHSTETATLGLPQFADADRPTFRGDINLAFNKLDTDAANFRSKVASIALGVTTDSFKLMSGAGDQSAALAAWYADPNLSGLRRLTGTGHVTAEVPVPVGIHTNARTATLIQDTANTAILNMAGGNHLEGGNFIGKATDFVARTGSFTPVAIGVKVAGNRSSVEGSVFTGFGHAAIYCIGATYTHIDGAEVYGPNGVSGVIVPAGDSGSFGVYFGLGCTDTVVNDLRAENVSVGLINSRDSARFNLLGARFRNIPGQHGAYLQNGTNLKVADLVGDGVNLNLCKLQISNTNGADQLAPNFNGISGTGIGDTVLSINNIDADLSRSDGAYKILSPVISNISGQNVLRVLYLGSVVGASASTIAGHNVGSDTITILDAQDTVVEGFGSHTSQKVGVRVTTQTGAKTRGLTVKGGRIYNPGSGNVAGSKQGVVVTCSGDPNDGKNITVDDVHSYSDNGLMDYGIQVTSAEMATYRQRNCTAIGYITRPFAVPAGTLDIREWVNNDADGKQTLNYPMNRPVRTGSVGDNAMYACNVQPVSGVFVAGDIVHNTGPIGAGTPGWVVTAAGGGNSGSWAATTAYTVGTWIRTSAGRVLACTTAGTSGATEPVVGAIGGTINDGTVVWTYKATTPATFKARANVAA